MKKKSITISDIAAKTGYSKTTVSFAFNWPNRISAEAVSRIMEVAKEMGYKGSGDPYAEPEPRYKTICLFVPETKATGHAPIWARSLMGIYQLCETQGYMLSLISEKRMSDQFFTKSSAVDAFVAFSTVEPAQMFLDVERKRHIPVIVVNLDCDETDPVKADEIRVKRSIECVQVLFDIVSSKKYPETLESEAFSFLSIND